MGCYSTFELTIEEQPAVSYEEHKKAIQLASNYPTGLEGEQIRWHDCAEDMKKYSKLYPLTLFILDVNSEDNNMYRLYFQNGKVHSQPPTISYPTFNPANLK